ncbi:uncharacterized protein FSUBG_13492 [Fusarium subglutinans]|uniref:Uncharacterized protein n=1 Tax=Gibberella subglutinans TaxID=42677 RepID=A0A8H5KWI2_GIBSU|nr:uncharacterized protein FSUBG_13492 [Fusarium subglutinans]KAF5580053.1 hypothetical protein FSUBG_13492 [Fusarium subglutinans]
MSDDYLDFCPIASRRPHVRAYLEYIYPDLADTLDWKWRVASQEICQTYFFKNVEKVQAPVFDFLVDHEVWEMFFGEIKSEMTGKPLARIPQWPFQMTTEMIVARKTAKRESLISDISASTALSNASSSFVPQVPLPASKPSPDASSNDAVASVTQPPSIVPREINIETLSTSMPPDLSKYQQRLWFWKLTGGNSLSFRSPIIGPFQMQVPPHVSFDNCVTGPDLQHSQKIKSALLPRGCCLKTEIIMVHDNDEKPGVVLTLEFAEGYGGKVYDRVELLRFWGGMTDWLSKVYDGASLSLYSHLLDSLVSRNGNISAVSKGLEHFNAARRSSPTNAEYPVHKLWFMCSNSTSLGQKHICPAFIFTGVPALSQLTCGTLHNNSHPSAHSRSPHNTTSTGLATSTVSFIEMANNSDKTKQVQDDKGISGPLLHVLPPNAFQHPPMDERVNKMADGTIKEYVKRYTDQYIGQLRRNQLVVSNFTGRPAILFRSDDASRIAQVDEMAWSMKNDDQIVDGIMMSNGNEIYGVVWLTNDKTLEDEDAKTKSKALRKHHPGTASKDEVEWKIEYDEEALFGGDDMLWMGDSIEKTPM